MTQNKRVPWAGVNHLAMITNDMDATVRFWHGVLGAPLVATLHTPEFRHYFFDIGPGSTVAFFEYLDRDEVRPSTTLRKPAGVYDPRAGHFDHLSLGLPDDQALRDLQDRLRDSGCEVTEMVDHKLIHSIYFTDPNGIALEASCWIEVPDRVDYDDPTYFADADPVPAVHEIASGGLLGTPVTTLTDTITVN